MKYFIITFGCQMNKSDSERIASILRKMKYEKASRIKDADLIVINMCSVRQSAVDRIYGKVNEINKMKTGKKKIKTLLTGCVPKRDLKKFENKFDYIFNIKSLNHWKKFFEKNECFHYSDSKDLGIDYFKIKPAYSNRFSVFVPISTGCNSFCTYCIVPYVRGPLTHRNYKEILEEIKAAIKKGAKEIWLLGQNVNSYKSGNINFARLLKLTNKIPGEFWIRFTSSHPKDFSDELIKTMKSCKKITNYLNLPVQAGDNGILKKMNRPYAIRDYKNLVKKIRNKMPDICLSTDVIVGFPGETKKQFENTCKLFKEIKFDMAYIAEYSPRPGTVAEKMKDSVSREEKGERARILTEILKKTALENNKKYIGKTIEVLPDSFQDGFLTGKTESYKTVRFKGSKNLIGRFTKVKIVNISSWGLKGE